MTARYVIGADEVGTGAWAGPFVVCAVAVPKDWKPPPGLRDSKKYKTRRRRNAMYVSLMSLGLPFSLALVESANIDKLGLPRSWSMAITYVVRQLLPRFPGAEVILDGTKHIQGIPNLRCEAQADDKYPAVSAASVIAKVNRDLLMQNYEQVYPGYDFGHNVGYRSKDHLLGLAKRGPCPIHRMSFRPLKNGEYFRRPL